MLKNYFTSEDATFTLQFKRTIFRTQSEQQYYQVIFHRDKIYFQIQT